MNEYVTLYQVTLSGFSLVLSSFLYSLGGRSGKWKRRFIAPFILTLTVCILMLWRGMWDWRLPFLYPILAIGFSLGYGSEIILTKILKRSIYAIAIVMTGVLLCLVIDNRAWSIFIPHVGVAAWSIYLGVINPIEAAAEEFWVCMVLNSGLMMYPFLG